MLLPQCPLCRGEDATSHAAYPEHTWVRCSCGLIYKRGARRAAHDARIYDPDYFRAGDAKHAHAYDRHTARRVAKSRRQILDALNHTAPGPVLDVGCSLGYTLQAARELGLESAGIDIAPFAVEACRKRGHRAELGGLDRMPFADGAFAVVTMKHVLEHTPDPRTALAEARRVLRPGGALFIAIPHAGYHKAVRDPLRSRFYRPDCPGGTEHFVYYTPATLSCLLTDCGFRVARVHPHLQHRLARPLGRFLRGLAAPFRALAGRIADALGLRKEFWLVATRA